MLMDVFCVGVAKAGTTSLGELLSQEPEICCGRIKEPNYFAHDFMLSKKLFCLDDNVVVKSLKDVKNLHHSAIIQDEYIYRSLYSKTAKIKVDLSTSYSCAPSAADEIYQFNPNAKIIFMLRDPYKRAISHYGMDIKIGHKLDSFYNECKRELWLKATNRHNECRGYILNSEYSEIIKRFSNLFPKKNIKIIRFEDFFLSNEPEKYQKELFEFLNIPYKNFIDIENKNISHIPRFENLNNILFSTGIKTLVKRNLPNYVKHPLRKIFFKSGKKNLDFSVFNEVKEFFDHQTIFYNSQSK